MTPPNDQECLECEFTNGLVFSYKHQRWLPCPHNGTGRKPAASKPDVERLYTGNSPTSMEHRAFATRGLRERLGYTMSPKDWVLASAYDAKVAECAAKDARVMELERDVRALRAAEEENRALLRDREDHITLMAKGGEQLLADNTRLREALTKTPCTCAVGDFGELWQCQRCAALYPLPAPEVPR